MIQVIKTAAKDQSNTPEKRKQTGKRKVYEVTMQYQRQNDDENKTYD